MSSFFTIPGKRKRSGDSEKPQKRAKAPVGKTTRGGSASKRGGAYGGSAQTKKQQQQQQQQQKTSGPRDDDDDESISGSDSEDDEVASAASDREDGAEGSESEEGEGMTAAERRLALAENYLQNVRNEQLEVGFDAADIDKDIIAERIALDVAESKGRAYRQLAPEHAFEQATHCYFHNNHETVTSVAVREPYAYTTTKDLYVHRWRIQDLPKDQAQRPAQSGKKKNKNKKPPPPPKRKPQLEQWIRGNMHKSQEKGYQRHLGRILCVAVSPDGKFLVTGGEDKRLIVHDAESLKPLRVFTHHRDAITGLAFRRGTNQLFSCSRDRTVKVWSLDELAYVETLFGHQDAVVDVDALAQERCVSVGARDRTARLWKVVEETQLVFRGGGSGVDKKNPLKDTIDPRSLSYEGSIDRIAMLDDELFVTGGDNGAIALWSVAKKKPLHVVPLAHGLEEPLLPTEASAEQAPDDDVVPPQHPRWITALKTVPYSDVILSGSWDGYVRVWKLSDDKKKIEPVGTLGAAAETSISNGDAAEAMSISHPQASDDGFRIRGIVNDIGVFERGKRGKDGLCIVVATGKEHRLGRWHMGKGKAKNGSYVFEVPRVIPLKPETNGDDHEADAAEESG